MPASAYREQIDAWKDAICDDVFCEDAPSETAGEPADHVECSLPDRDPDPDPST
ncbi:hypothetical protein [Desulfobaculum bizertense]|uniref:hypothetical protein n=1 Tax=Desulfobaculum bizertense TaxID=376490 RepID=UPI0013565D70|nr:hypothetical protein [Desulfobaculum bizertense]